jgi:hypothetical protein
VSPSRRGIARDSRWHASGQRPQARATAGAPAARTCRDRCAVACGVPGGGILVNPPAVRRAGTCGKWCAVAATTGLHRFIQQERHQPVARAGSHKRSREIVPLSNYLGSVHPAPVRTEGGAGRTCDHGVAGVAGLLMCACVAGTAWAGQYRRPGSETRESEGNSKNPRRRRSVGMSFQGAIRNAVSRSAGMHSGMPWSVLILHRERSSWSGT